MRYVHDYYKEIPGKVASDISRWPKESLRAVDVEQAAQNYVSRYSLIPIRYDRTRIEYELLAENDPAAGVRIRIPYEPEGRAAPILELIPSTFLRPEPAVRESRGFLEFEVRSANVQEITQLVENLLQNLDFRSNDIEQSNGRLYREIHEVVERSTSEFRAETERAEQALRSLPFSRRGASAEPQTISPPAPTAVPEETPSISPSSEVVGRTTTAAIRVSSIDVVIGVVREYLDELRRHEDFEMAALYSGLEFQLQQLRGYAERGLETEEAAQGVLQHLRHVREKMRPWAQTLDKAHKAYVIFSALGKLLGSD